VKAVILNSGVGSRMGELTLNKSKCLVPVDKNETILSRQLKMLIKAEIFDILITIGPYGNQIPDYVGQLFPELPVVYVRNEEFNSTNYIYSMYLADSLLREDILLMHGDIVLEEKVLTDIINSKNKDVVIVDSTVTLPEKDFKGKVVDSFITEIGINIKKADNVYFLLPVYKLSANFMNKWMDEIAVFVSRNETGVYAENAFNSISSKLELRYMDIKGGFCMEVDTEEDLEHAKVKINE
jgi:L-glutamine-phosphate cytidylyltransferase